MLTRRIVWSGFVIFDHQARFAEAMDALAGMHRAGTMVSDEDITQGLEGAPGAIAELYEGRNSGKRLIQLG